MEFFLTVNLYNLNKLVNKNLPVQQQYLNQFLRPENDVKKRELFAEIFWNFGSKNFKTKNFKTKNI